MTNNAPNWIADYIWGIADDVLRDLYVRGKYRDVIPPMTVLRRLDAVLEDGKQAVFDMRLRSIRPGRSNRMPPCARPRARPSTMLRLSTCGT